MTTTSTKGIPQHAVDKLSAALPGAVIRPDDAAYDDARSVWNGMIERRPELIARPKDAAGVSAVVRLAGELGVPLAVRGGGHNVAGSAVADGAIVVDLSSMRGVSVDAERPIVTAQGGALLGDIDKETQKHGLAVPMGVVSETGIAGLTLGGGLGWLRRKYGLSVDNLLRVEVVLADGSIVNADAQRNPDLFWAVRGGGGNFGVVTSFVFRAYPIGPEVTMLVAFHPLEEGVGALRFFREYMKTVPDELSSFAIVGGVPEAEMFPEAARGRDAVIFAAAWCGDPAEGERIIAPLRSFTEPLVDLSGPWAYGDVQTFFDEDYPKGGRYYWKSQYINTLTDEAIDALVEFGRSRPSKASTIDLWHLGGAIARVAADATPVPQRQAEYLIRIESNWTDAADDAANMAWARDLWAACQKFSDAGIYVNFAGFGEEGDSLVRAAYGDNYARLAQIKAKYDPKNLFRINQNIKPAG